MRGPCKDLTESKAWMAGIVPLPMPTNKVRISYLVLYAESDGHLTHPKQVDGEDWKMAGVVTLLPTNFKLEGEVDDFIRGNGDPYKAVELGYLFMPEVWGQGFATESVRAVLDAYRQDIQDTNALFPREIHATVHEKNTGSRRVLEKVGFKEFGRFEGQGSLPLVDDLQTHTAIHFRMGDH